MADWRVELMWPPATLSGHAKGNRWVKVAPTKAHRKWAAMAVRTAGLPPVPQGKHDLKLRVDFHPPDRRGDRINYPIRVKPCIDGVAEALGVNDARFLPEYHFHEPLKPDGKVVLTITDDTCAELKSSA